ncbi:hypothetical protein FNW02_36055 [Komarekiella sp. 'clone 1']|uniref:Uncharacterized protein n=1 Tax=Komarekiella delphini-convector SJRDD-AB1 TaxID=2593771 RepID=A0AA40VVG3_9NOST|nr:hypothetical protein [Komarekiella delphini-convector]MBD6621000.1 hypothetical protein [Komarekiella delphini-convector SJRDD-AB1]
MTEASIILKPTFTSNLKIKALLLLTAILLVWQAHANGEQQFSPLTPTQTQNLSRDLVPFGSQDFFREGKDLIDREIQLLRQRQAPSTEPLKINLVPQVKKDCSPSNKSDVSCK